MSGTGQAEAEDTRPEKRPPPSKTPAKPTHESEAEDAGSFSDAEPAAHDAVSDPPEVICLDDGRSVLVDVSIGKQLLLPGKFEWAVKKATDDKGATTYMLECLTGSHVPRSVSKALSTQSTPY